MNLRNENIADLNYGIYIAYDLGKQMPFLPFMSMRKILHRTKGEEWTKYCLMGTLIATGVPSSDW
jgi:hypothetical protein